MSEIKLSVIIPVYNQEDLVLRAIKSIPNLDEIEIIVVDDCSVDNTLKNVEKFRGKTRLDEQNINHYSM